jgi:SNF2 family DNA or RNA helicase
VTQGPLDVFSQCKFLHPEALPYRTYTAFKSTFAEETLITLQNRSFRKITGYKNLTMLTAQLSPFSLKLDKKDCLDLPPKVFTERVVPLTRDQERIYRDMRDLCIAQMENGEIVTASMALTKLVKLHQILTGFVVDDEGQPHPISNHRIESLLDVAQVTSPLVIFCAYRYNVVQLKQALEEAHGEGSVVTYYGDTPKKDREEAVERFQSGYADFFIGTSAAAKGITLHRASTMIYYSNSYSLETRLQSQDRIHRIGQDRKCTYVDLVTPSSLDEMILKALTQKKDLADTILDDLRSLLL